MGLWLGNRASIGSRHCLGGAGSGAERLVDNDPKVIFGPLRAPGYTFSAHAEASEWFGNCGLS